MTRRCPLTLYVYLTMIISSCLCRRSLLARAQAAFLHGGVRKITRSRHFEGRIFVSRSSMGLRRAVLASDSARTTRHTLNLARLFSSKTPSDDKSEAEIEAEAEAEAKAIERLGTDQDEYKMQMRDWRGRSHSTSEFVSHFIASGNNVTIEQAISSVMPQRIDIQMCKQDEDVQGPELESEYKGRRGTINNNITERRAFLSNRERADDELLQNVDTKFRLDPSHFPYDADSLYPVDLLGLGGIWFLPADAPKDPALGAKPIRLDVQNLTSVMAEGDYLRVHHSPRRFPAVSKVDWGKNILDLDGNIDEQNNIPGVIVQEDTEKGYIVLNKPPGVPVHPTVDNLLENVAGCIGRSLLDRNRDELEGKMLELSLGARSNSTRTNNNNNKENKDDNELLYVVTPQRLDQNTSGLFVVATKKQFASYYAKLLRTKTDTIIKQGVAGVDESGRETKLSLTNENKQGQIKKKYRCLVCIISKDSTTDEFDRLLSLKNSLVTHYLEKGFGAPRTFSSMRNEDWLPCLLKITDVGKAIPVGGSAASRKLCTAIWGDCDEKPDNCSVIVQVEVELLTGRTHQIRGQMSSLGFPLCGDNVYGGTTSRDTGYVNSDMLALQCCELQFPDPDYEDSNAAEIEREKEIRAHNPAYRKKHKKKKIKAVCSKRLNSFRLDGAWWTHLLEESIRS